ncbi:MAG: hypothetical protein CMJ15_12330 [Pelagibacterium sp.]|nr:hypothetical protein [Pelagibacterium sp.]
MTFPRLLFFVLPAVIVLTPIQAAHAQYQSLDETAEIGSGDAFGWAVQIDAGDITLNGNVPYQSVATILSGRAGIDDDGMTIADGAPLGFLRDAMKAIAASEMLEDGSIAYGAGQWTVTGTLRPDASRDALIEALGSAGDGAEWVLAIEAPGGGDAEDIQAPGPIGEDVMESVEGLLEESEPAREDVTEIIETADAEASTQSTADTVLEPEVEADDATGEQPLSDDIVDAVPTEGTTERQAPVDEDSPQDQAIVQEQQDIAPTDPIVPDGDAAANANLEAEATQCREQVAALTQDNAISFASGRTTPTMSSESLIADIAAVLAICPAQPVYVEGHTDADGRDETNLVLSLSRAEAVVDRLVAQGIDPQRLFAVGYGASLPVASNETAAGKAQNRRIVFSFEDIAQ